MKDEYLLQKEVNKRHVRVYGPVDTQETSRDGIDHLLIFVSVEAKARNYGRKPRDTALYTVYRADGTVEANKMFQQRPETRKDGNLYGTAAQRKAGVQ